MRPIQAELFEAAAPVKDAVAYFSEASAESRGAIHTRPGVAEFILDLMGWSGGNRLLNSRLLEPAAGEGDFLIPAVRRLLDKVEPDDLSIAPCIRAVEVNLGALATCRQRLHDLLSERGWSRLKSEQLLGDWLVHADFLTVPLLPEFTHVVGNPLTCGWRACQRTCSGSTGANGRRSLIAPIFTSPSSKNPWGCFDPRAASVSSAPIAG